MAARKINNKAESPVSTSRPRDLPRGESRKLVTDDGRRHRFKDRGKDLERGISAPSLFAKEGDSPSTPKAPMPLNEGEVITVGQGMGHDFAKKTFFQPTYCHYCSELLWGLKGQGYMCKGGLQLQLLCVASSRTLRMLISLQFATTSPMRSAFHTLARPAGMS